MDQLLARLRTVVDDGWPTDTSDAQATWRIHTIFGSPAPVVALSRDPKAGATLSPVYFIAAEDEAARDDLAARIYGLTGRLAKLRHTLRAADGTEYLFVPPMFHEDKLADFTAAMDAALVAEAAERPIAWLVEPCVQLISKDLLTWSLELDADGSVRVMTRDHTLAVGA